ncbi:hypothetical protein [Streptosporangium sp. NPDC001681]|uniref:hypothetical protein n=1 Tax=Streptosporangium sp. NPDC001681 TaxID=3154395 RepID=UPI0033288DE5
MTGGTGLNRDTEDAIRALAHRVYGRDQQDTAERPAPADFAFEFVMTLRGQGWRCTNAGQAPKNTARPRPDTYDRGVALARQLLQKPANDDQEDNPHD